jgi:NADH:ubiquinone oxidoreductase subunit H
MKFTPDTLASIFGAITGISQLLGQVGIINQQAANSISSIAVILLGWVSNKTSPTK